MNNAVEKILTPNFNGEKDAYGTKRFVILFQKNGWVWIKYTLNESGAINLINFFIKGRIFIFEKNRKSEKADRKIVGDVYLNKGLPLLNIAVISEGKVSIIYCMNHVIKMQRGYTIIILCRIRVKEEVYLRMYPPKIYKDESQRKLYP